MCNYPYKRYICRCYVSLQHRHTVYTPHTPTTGTSVVSIHARQTSVTYQALQDTHLLLQVPLQERLCCKYPCKTYICYFKYPVKPCKTHIFYFKYPYKRDSVVSTLARHTSVTLSTLSSPARHTSFTASTPTREILL